MISTYDLSTRRCGGGPGLTFIIIHLSYKRIPIMIINRRRRLGEAIVIICGIAIAGVGSGIGDTALLAGGLAIMGLGVVSIFWN
jgi:hypothetical protein